MLDVDLYLFPPHQLFQRRHVEGTRSELLLKDTVYDAFERTEVERFGRYQQGCRLHAACDQITCKDQLYLVSKVF